MQPYRFFALAIVGVSLLVVPSSAQAQTPPPVDDKTVTTLRQFFAESDAVKRADLAAKVAPLMPASPADWPALLRRAYPFADTKMGLHNFEAPADGIVPAIKYVVSVPEGYQADPAQPWPLIVGIPGTGGSGGQALSSLSKWLGDDLGKFLIACPDAPDKEVYSFNELYVVYPQRVLDDVRRRLNVDGNRVILTGYSKGGYTTWGTVLFSPAQWAGAAPMASFPLTDAGRHGFELYLANVLNLDLQFHWGDQDILAGQTEGINTFARSAAGEMKRLKATRFEPIEYAGQGHGLTIDADKLKAFLAKARRTPWPASYTFTFHHVWEGSSYHVRAVKTSLLELDFKNLPSVRVANSADAKTAAIKLFRDRSYEFRVDVGDKANSISVRTRNLREIEISLSPQQLDFSKPVRVLVDGKPVQEKKLDLDWKLLLETVRTSGDFDRLVGAKIAYTIPR